MARNSQWVQLSVSALLSFSLVVPTFPQIAYADPNESGNAAISDFTLDDLFGKGSGANGGGNNTKNTSGNTSTNTGNGALAPPHQNTTPKKNRPRTQPYNGGYGNGYNNQQYQNNPNNMMSANVPEEYSCPLLDNGTHAELLSAIDSLSSTIRANPECGKIGSTDAILKNNEELKESIKNLKQFTEMNPDELRSQMSGLEGNVSTAINAVNNLGQMLNNNALLNSRCGRQTMSTGKFLLAFNDLINGLTPYALFAVSVNAALSVALPYVAGAAVLTTGVSLFSQMYEKNTIDMENPDQRRAVLQNTCQFVKIARKVRLIQLAQTNQTSKITAELDKEIQLYSDKPINPSSKLITLISTRRKSMNGIAEIENQLRMDRAELELMESQLADAQNDEMMACMIVREMHKNGSNQKSFPSSIFNNLKRTMDLIEPESRLQLSTLTALHQTSQKRLTELGTKITEGEQSALQQCAQTGRSWIQGMKQAMKTISTLVIERKMDTEEELMENPEYRSLKAKYTQLQNERLLVERFEKAMTELSKGSSVIDRSELEQRITDLKSGLFGNRASFNFGASPVLAWLNHTKTMHDRRMSVFISELKSLQNDAYSLTSSGKPTQNKDMRLPDARKQVEDLKQARSLIPITKDVVKFGTREHQLTCQKLESAWLSWSAAIDHLGATQFFCDLLDPYIDGQVEKGITDYCRGTKQITGVDKRLSGIQAAQQVLVKNYYKEYAQIVGNKLKTLQCPMPGISSLK